jgi:hypothetical protein
MANGGQMAEDVQREAEELMRYYGELVRRMGQGGIKDVAGLLALYEQLKRALDSVSVHELTWAHERTAQLVNRLVGIDSGLQAIRRLKAALEGGGEHDAARPRS